MRYSSPNIFTKTGCDVHFVAFSTDKKIDMLLEADVYYQSQEGHDYSGWTWGHIYGEIKNNYSYLRFDKSIDWVSNKWYVSDQRSFPTILTSAEFVESEEYTGKSYSAGIFNNTTVNSLKPSVKEDLSSKDWVLRFAITDYTYTERQSAQTIYSDYYYTIVSNVSILRLKFDTDGVIYNLGVVDNKQTGSRTPANETGCRGIDWRMFLFMAAVVTITIFTLKYEGFRKVVLWIVKYAGHIALWPILLTILIVQKVKGV